MCKFGTNFYQYMYIGYRFSLVNNGLFYKLSRQTFNICQYKQYCLCVEIDNETTSFISCTNFSSTAGLYFFQNSYNCN